MTDQWQVAEELLLQPTDVDTNQIQDALGQMLSRQVDYADLYFEYSRREAFSLEEGRIQGGSYGIDQGVGVRAVSGEKTGFAYSDEIVPSALLDSAKAARAIATSGGEANVPVLTRTPGPAPLYSPADPLVSISDAAKVQMLEMVDAEARARDPRVKEVMAGLSGTFKAVLVANADGRLVTDIRPLVRLKLAASLDGRTAMASGESQWITGSAARDDVQRLRARSSAIVTGRGTAVMDRPSLTVRPEQWQYPDYPEGEVRRPLRVVLDRTLATPGDTPLMTAPGSVLLLCTGAADEQRRSALEASGGEIMTLAADQDRVSLPGVLDELGRRACNEVLFECGAELAGDLMRHALVDEVMLYMAPILLGSSARPLMALPGIEHMSEQLRLRLTDLRHLGDDLRLTLAPAPTD